MIPTPVSTQVRARISVQFSDNRAPAHGRVPPPKPYGWLWQGLPSFATCPGWPCDRYRSGRSGSAPPRPRTAFAAKVASGEPRLTFGRSEPYGDIECVPTAIGLFAIADMVNRPRRGRSRPSPLASPASRSDFRHGFPAARGRARSSAALRLVRGQGAAPRLEFGNRAVEGLTGPEV